MTSDAALVGLVWEERGVREERGLQQVDEL